MTRTSRLIFIMDFSKIYKKIYEANMPETLKDNQAENALYITLRKKIRKDPMFWYGHAFTRDHQIDWVLDYAASEELWPKDFNPEEDMARYERIAANVVDLLNREQEQIEKEAYNDSQRKQNTYTLNGYYDVVPNSREVTDYIEYLQPYGADWEIADNTFRMEAEYVKEVIENSVDSEKDIHIYHALVNKYDYSYVRGKEIKDIFEYFEV